MPTLGGVTTYHHDAAGNRTQVDRPDGTSDYFAWDAQSRMNVATVGGNVVTMTYNALGQRVAKETAGGTTRYRYDHKTLIQEANVDDELTKSYTTTDEEYGDLISEYDFEDQGFGVGEFYQQFDAQASADAMLDESGGVVQRFRLQAFGLPAQSAGLGFSGWVDLSSDQWSDLSVDGWASLPVNPGSVPGNFKHGWGGKKGYYLDSELELYMLGMGSNGRLYDPVTAKFLSADPIRYAGGDTTLNRYVGNDPVNHLDPSGHDRIIVDGKMAKYEFQDGYRADKFWVDIGTVANDGSEWDWVNVDKSLGGGLLRIHEMNQDVSNSLPGAQSGADTGQKRHVFVATEMNKLRNDQFYGRAPQGSSSIWAYLPQAVGDTLGEYAKDISDLALKAFKIALDEAGLSGDQIIAMMKEWASDLPAAMKALITRAASILGDMLAGVKKGVADFVGSPDGNPVNVDFKVLLKHVISAVENWLGLPGIGEFISKVISGGTAIFDTVVGEILDLLHLDWNSILDLVGKELGDNTLVMQIAAWVGEAMESGKDLASWLLAKGESAIEGVTQWIKNLPGELGKYLWDTITGLIPGIVKDVVVGLASKFAGPAAWLKTLFDGLKFFWNNKSQIGGLLEAMKDGFLRVIKGGAGLIDDVANMVVSGIEKVVPILIGALATALGINGIPEKIKTALADLWKLVQKPLKDLIHLLAKPFKVMIDDVRRTLGGRTLVGFPVENEDGTSTLTLEVDKDGNYGIWERCSPDKIVDNAEAKPLADLAPHDNDADKARKFAKAVLEAAKGKGKKGSSTDDDEEADAPAPEEYIDKVHVIDMDKAPPGSKNNAAGHPRNGPWFWRQMLAKYPTMFSATNKVKIVAGSSPFVDDVWIKADPMHKEFDKDKLIHHHIDQGNMASGLPQSAHRVWHGVIHQNSGGSR